MSNTLITCVDKYYKYGGDIEGNKRELTIGGYKSAWLAKLAALYILAKIDELFQNMLYHGIYRYDRFIIFKGSKTKREINTWLMSFKNK